MAIGRSMHEAARYRLGLVLVTASAVAWSTAGFFTRLIPLDTWTLLFWRGIFGAMGIGVFMAVQPAKTGWAGFFRLDWAGWVFVALSTVGMLCFIASLKLTSVAHASVVYATAPLMAAAMAWRVMRERASRSALLSSIAAIAGVAVMVGLGYEGTLLGDALALGMTACMAAMMVVARRYQGIPMLPAACLSAGFSALIALPFAQPGLPEGLNLLYLALFGLVNSALGLALFAIGAKLLPASETALIGALDAPLAPVWVALAFGEMPSGVTLVGGGVVFMAIFAHIVLSSAVAHRVE